LAHGNRGLLFVFFLFFFHESIGESGLVDQNTN